MRATNDVPVVRSCYCSQTRDDERDDDERDDDERDDDERDEQDEREEVPDERVRVRAQELRDKETKRPSTRSQELKTNSNAPRTVPLTQVSNSEVDGEAAIMVCNRHPRYRCRARSPFASELHVLKAPRLYVKGRGVPVAHGYQ